MVLCIPLSILGLFYLNLGSMFFNTKTHGAMTRRGGTPLLALCLDHVMFSGVCCMCVFS